MKSCIVLSIPRAGTHLVMQLLNMLGMKEYRVPNPTDGYYHDKVFYVPLIGHYVFGSHMWNNEKYKNLFLKSKLKAILITRDLRDIAVSLAFHIKRDKTHKEHNYFQKSDIGTCISRTINLVEKRYRLNAIGWRDVNNVYSTTFEKIVGNKKSREQEIKNIAEHLEIPLTEELFKYCVDNLVGSNKLYPTIFRKGIIGDWKNYFKEEHKELFKQVAGQLLIEEGYEKDLKW